MTGVAASVTGALTYCSVNGMHECVFLVERIAKADTLVPVQICVRHLREASAHETPLYLLLRLPGPGPGSRASSGSPCPEDILCTTHHLAQICKRMRPPLML